MNAIRVFVMMLALAVAPALAQDAVTDAAPLEAGDDAAPTPDDEAGGDVAESGDEADDEEDSDLDEQTYERQRPVFVPTEEIPADEPIPFPSNI